MTTRVPGSSAAWGTASPAPVVNHAVSEDIPNNSGAALDSGSTSRASAAPGQHGAATSYMGARRRGLTSPAAPAREDVAPSSQRPSRPSERRPDTQSNPGTAIASGAERERPDKRSETIRDRRPVTGQKLWDQAESAVSPPFWPVTGERPPLSGRQK